MSITPSDDEWWIFGDHIDNGDWRGSPLTNAFIDVVLLAFIRAHPMQEVDEPEQAAQTENAPHVRSHYGEAKRLSAAKEALFGIKPSTGSYKKYFDLPELVWMGKAYLEDRNGSVPTDNEGHFLYIALDDPKHRTVQTLAELALQIKQESGGPKEVAADRSAATRLSVKFREGFHEIIRFAYEGGDLPMLVERFRKLRAVLGPVGIPMSEPADFIRDLSRAP